MCFIVISVPICLGDRYSWKYIRVDIEVGDLWRWLAFLDAVCGRSEISLVFARIAFAAASSRLSQKLLGEIWYKTKFDDVNWNSNCERCMSSPLGIYIDGNLSEQFLRIENLFVLHPQIQQLLNLTHANEISNNCYSVSRKFVCREFIHQEPCMSMWSEAFTLKLISQVSKLWRDVRLYTDWSIKIKCEKVFRCFRCAWGA